MFPTICWSSYCLATLTFLFYPDPGNAQSARSFFVGESVLFAISPANGDSYFWSVSDKLETYKKVESDKATYLTTKYDSFVRLRWERGGTFYVTVTSFNLHGCSNSKIFQVNVLDQHNPEANDDYNSTDWLKSIRMNLLDNDHDACNDLDTLSFKILTKTEFGEVAPGQKGSITYKPFIKHAATERFYYRICDNGNQCDTALVAITIKNPPLFLPEGISPNGDGVNDCFVISGLNAYPKSSLTIFSRDGIVIFDTDDYQNDWNGMIFNQKQSTKKVPAGTYYYLLHPGGSFRVVKGFIYLTY